MYQTSLFFRVQKSSTEPNYSLLEFFFKYWVDDICLNEVQYKLVEASDNSEIYQVDFDHIEDATVLKLRGIPARLQNYIELVA